MAQAALPLMQGTAAAGLSAGKRGMSMLARLLTGGGRAAYTELVSPQASAEGSVLNVAQEQFVPAPLEPAAFLFAAALLAGLFSLLLTNALQVVLLIVIAVIALLALNWLGVRRPFFTRLTIDAIVRSHKPAPLVSFQMRERANPNAGPLTVVLLGPRTSGEIRPNDLVKIYGIHDKGRRELRAWKVAVSEPGASWTNDVRAPRLIPFAVALFVVPLEIFLLSLVRLLLVH